MELELSEEQRAIVDSVLRFAADRLSPRAAEWDAQEHFPVDVLREAATLGFAGINVKDDVGGPR